MSGWLWQPHVVLLFAGTVASLVGVFLAWLRRTYSAAHYLIRLMTANTLWVFASMLEAGVTTLEDKLFWTRIQYVGLVAVPPCLLLFVLSYTRRDFVITRQLRWVLTAVAVGNLTLLFTNPWHNRFYTGFSWSPDAVNVLIYHHGLLYYLTQVFFYSQVGATLLIMLNDILFSRPHLRNRLLVMLLAIALPAGIGVLYNLRVTPLLGLDWAPLASALSSTLLVWTLYRFQLLTIVPVAYEAVFTNVGKAIFVLNQDQQLLDLNPAAEQLIGQSAHQVIGRPWPDVWQSLGRDQHLPLTPADPHAPAVEVQLGDPPADRSFDVTTFPFVDPVIRSEGRLIVFQEITARKRIEAELRELNAHLEQKVLEQTADLRAAQQHLAHRLSEQSRKLSGLYDVILLSGAGQRDAQQLLTDALLKVRSIVDSDRLVLLQHSGDQLIQQAHVGRNGPDTITLPPLPLDWFSADTQTHVFADLQVEPDLPPALAAAGYHTCLIRRLSSSEGFSGALLALWLDLQPIGVEDTALFSALADELSLMLEIEQRRREATRFAVIEERHRLARDLHDSITQSLHSLMLTAENARSVAQSDPQRLDQFLQHLLSSARHALTETRLLLFELRPQLTQNQTLIDLLQIRLESVERRVGIEAAVSFEGDTPWPAAWDHDLYALILEALNNALKHAQASEITVTVTSTPERFRLLVNDNGRGFVPARTSRGGMGMVTMADRARQLGGVLRIESLPGYGTRIELVIPRSARSSAVDLPHAGTAAV